MMSSRLFKRIAAGLALTVFGTVFGIAICEAALRIAGISYPVFETFDELRGIALRPGKEGWYRKEGEAYIKLNSLGYRDTDHPAAKQPNAFRIAVLGDSFVEARQVALKDTFASHLGRNLIGCPALAGQQVEVLNFGVGGYATTEELLTWRQHVLRFSPDLVLLGFYAGNDVGENSKQLTQGDGAQWRMPKPVHVFSNGELVLESSFRRSTWRRILYEGVHHSRLLEVLNEARRVWDVRKMKQAAKQPQDNFEMGISKDVYAPPVDAAWRDAWLITDALLGQMKGEVTATGARFAVTTVTMSEQVHPDPKVRTAVERRLGVDNLLYPEQRIAEIGQKHGFPVIRLAEPLQTVATRDRVFLHGFKNTVMGFGHWNENGHSEAGRVLAKEVCDKVLAAGS
jgi:hypothetical protein